MENSFDIFETPINLVSKDIDRKSLKG